MNIEKQGPGGVTEISRMDFPTGQLVHEPGIDSPEGKLPLSGLLAGTLNVVQNSFDLGGREVRINHQAGSFREEFRPPAFTNLLADTLALTGLPHDCVIDGFPGCPIPDHSCFTLIRDAQSAYLPEIDPTLLQTLSQGPELGLPDFPWVVFDPAGLREDLSELARTRCNLIPLLIEENGP